MKAPYLFGSRTVTHLCFWLLYYVTFGLIWARNGNYLDSFYLEFVLLPVRVLTVYFTIYTLLPLLLLERKFLKFFLAYSLTLLIAGVLQRSFMYFFYESQQSFQIVSFFSINEILRSMLLINSTALFLVAIKLYLLYADATERSEQLETSEEKSQVEVRSEKRVYKILPSDIVYLEGMGNYVTYHMTDKKIIVYSSLKAAQSQLGKSFTRVHKSYVINQQYVKSYSKENVEVKGGKMIPISPTYRDSMVS